jgi:hypothetical protein
MARTFASLRFGELAALRRGDIDLRTCEVRVARSLIQMNGGRLIDDEPKSRAGRRIIAFRRRWPLSRGGIWTDS